MQFTAPPRCHHEMATLSVLLALWAGNHPPCTKGSNGEPCFLLAWRCLWRNNPITGDLSHCVYMTSLQWHHCDVTNLQNPWDVAGPCAAVSQLHYPLPGGVRQRAPVHKHPAELVYTTMTCREKKTFLVRPLKLLCKGFNYKYWNVDVILTEFSALAASEVAIMATSDAAIEENFINMASFLYQCTELTQRLM